ncbi:MAG: type IV pili methyl-accepting chemotaxis transducer N-terminal domain-containing protein, partial [Deltaproteobacteria bacterium]|nr:type IV pili methyl-accepting chemotaxis transducer N-terminal domain-containing protein [Deltaproteobacteria bacterium]
MNMQSLKFRYAFCFVSLGFLLLSVVVVTYIMGRANEDTGQIINVSGGQRMRTVKLAYLLERYQVNYGPSELKVIEDTVSDYDARMKALESGSAFGIENGVSDAALKEELKKSIKIWGDFRILIKDGLAEKYDPNKIDAVINDLLSSLDKLTNGLADESVRKNKKAMMLEIGLTFIALCMIFAYTFTNNHYTVNPIAEIVKTVRAFAGGDITQRSKYATGLFEFKDEIYELEELLNTAIENTEIIISDIANSSSKIASSSEQLSASSTQIAKGAEAQTQKAAQVATAAEQMSATVIEVAKNASGASEAAKDANKAAHKGGEIVKRT